MKTVIAESGISRVIVLGYQGEDQIRRVVWQGIAAEYAEHYGAGVFTLAVRRRGDAVPYPVVISEEGDDVVWVVSDADTEQVGFGECELSYIVGDTVVKSQSWPTQTFRSIISEGISTDPPEPQKSWVEQVMQAGAAAETAMARVPEIGENGHWYVGLSDTGVSATGPKGDKGDDYALTAADKEEIAALALTELENGDEVAYG